MTSRSTKPAAPDHPQRADLPEILARVKAAGRTGGSTYRSASAVAAGLSKELRAADQLLLAGHAQAAVEVIESGIKLIEKAFATVDDSSGILGDLIRRLQQDHADACEQSGLEQTRLAVHLAKWAMRTDWEVFLESPTTHAAALGEVGLARFEAEVDKHYRLLPPLGPGESDERGGQVSAFNVTFLKTLLAARHGADAVVEVMARDLSYSYHYLKIAKVLAGAGRDDEAMRWLERGQGPEYGRRDERLDDFAAELHVRAGRVDIATDMAATRFGESPSAELYDRLHDFASESGDWTERRATALAVLEALPEAVGLDVTPAYRADPSGHSELVKVHLSEGDVGAAWRAAQQGGCTTRVWADVADARGAEHPADAMRVYQLLAVRELDVTDRAAYRRAAALIRRSHRFAEAAGLTSQSRAWILGVRNDNRRRPTLQDEFDRYGIPAS
ncbi:hypothetical protein ABIB25_003855 [Nakamurella sp. UYEF19]|uniref:hypothetical protein n=1 Tax=Nakamurella sp. UYEF19 TaxID=1756392 RepID=UPI0033950FB6